MKISTLLLAVSLTANAAVVAFFVVKSPAFAPAGAAGAASATAAAAATTPTSASGKSSPAAEAAQAAALAQVWTQLQSGDLSTLVTRLRAAGFSPWLIRSIVSAQVYEQFSARRKALLATREERPYWKNVMGPFYDPKTQTALRELNKEQTAMVKTLLGTDDTSSNDEFQYYQRRQFGDIPRSKVEQIQGIISDYSDLTQEIYAKSSGLVQLPEDREKIAYLEKEKLADLAKILTPQELEDYQMRNSNVASQLRYNLTTFNATEDEFRAIYRATAAVEAQLGTPGNYRTMDDMKKRQDALTAQLQGTLSPERLADLKTATDPEYQQINRLVTRLELPPSTSQQVVALQKDMQQRATALRNDRSLTPDTRNAQLSALSDEATTKLTSTLTARGLEAYKQNGGYWLQNLQPRPAPPSSGGTTTTTTVITRPAN